MEKLRKLVTNVDAFAYRHRFATALLALSCIAFIMYMYLLLGIVYKIIDLVARLMITK